MARATLAWAGRLLLALYFAAGLLILVGRHFLMPEVAGQRVMVEEKLSAAIGLPVKLAGLSAEWPGLHPRLVIDGLQLHDREGRPALHFDRVEAEIGWSSLWHLGPRLHRLEIVAPQLDIRRDPAGHFFVAGIQVETGGDGRFVDWLLGQGRIIVRDASLVWHDELRGAPPFELRHLEFELRNFGRHHSFGATAVPPAAVAAKLDVRGNLVSGVLADQADLAAWRGDLYADIEQADLTAWQPWLDLPLEWTRGRGGVRLWLDFAAGQPGGFTADLRLADVAVKLQPELPELVLTHLDGRLKGRRTGEGYEGVVRRLALTTQDGSVLPPLDARLKLMPQGRRAGGEFSANTLDLGTLAALAGHLPLPAPLHERLRDFKPQGQVADLDLRWEGPADAPSHWRTKARFAGLALAAHQKIPGFTGLSGSLEGDAGSGKVYLDSHNLRIELPTVFPEPVLVLAQLDAEAGWRKRAGGVEIELTRAAFRNADASGEAQGTYRYGGEGLGDIDLSAKLANAAGNAVWRYMPLAVNKDARDWLRTSIVGGVSDSTTLRLKGPLAGFPYRGGKGGIFQVKGTMRGATLDFAPGWPAMTGIDGELLFEGERMVIRGRRADIMGVGLAGVQAEIADLEAPEEILVVSGRAAGRTQRFLDFIEASPVGERIDHFTRTMQATGDGDLNLKLTMPLRHLADTRVDGRYRFTANELRVLPGLAPFSDAQGEFAFTADRLQAKNLRARLLGAPVTLDVATVAGGAVRVSAAGKLAALALRQEADLRGLRALDHLSGETSWRAAVTVRKPAAEVEFETNFEGLSSSLPAPFNKSARTPLPLKVTGRIEGARDDWTATLGRTAALRLQNRGNGWRGRLALGEDPPGAADSLPESGMALVVRQPQLDLDAWRELLAVPENGAAAPAATDGVALVAIDMRSDALRVAQREFHEVRIDGAKTGSRWRFKLDSREAKGQLQWDGTGAGRVSGRLTQLLVPAAAPGAPGGGGDGGSGTTQTLPAVDLVIDDFRLRDMAFGEVRVNAENREGAWQAKLEAKNEAARLVGTGRWRPSSIAPETRLAFRLDIEDGEKLLGRLGMPDAVRRGEGWIEGDLSWAGAPFGLHLPSLAGHVKTAVGKGQFKKLEPGVGRLLGVLSLQSLLRRITLDFRDVFSEGFAFDSIAGEAAVERGQMRTDELKIRGPAARVLLSGQVNLVAETQNLKVRVQPAVSESLAVGAMIANPIVGAVAWAAQKLLDDPLDKAFAYEYAVTGGWSDPKVEKLGQNPAAPKATPP